MNAAPAYPNVPQIELEHATLSRPDTNAVVVTEVNWKVSRGDYWIVCGLQGAGKTSIISTAAGLHQPVAGRHFLFGRDTARLHEEELAAERLRLGVVFENGGRLFSTLRLEDNVALPLRYHRDLPEDEVQERVNAMMEWAGVTAYAGEFPGRTSMVWRQRVALLRALALEPEVLLFDNPIAGLDPRQANWWFDTLAKLSAGLPLLGGRPITLVVAVGDFLPWLARGKQFALLDRKQWRVLGNRDEFAPRAEPLMAELLAAEPGDWQAAG